jgi:hypothetical protein
MPRSRSPSRNSPNSIINVSSPITTPEDFYNLATPPREIHPNITVRAPRRPRRRSLTMDDEEIYNTLLELDNDMNNSFSLTDDTETSFNNIQDNDRYGINASVPVSYERNDKYHLESLSNKTLDTHKGKIKIKTTETIYDPIMMEDANIHDYIKEDADNIVFLYEKKYYLSTKSTLKGFINMTTTDNAIVFDCRGIGYRNVNKDYPYVLINKIGIILNDFTNVISLENAIAITKSESGQYFFIKGTDDVLISTVTDNVLNGKYPNALGASHCQGGKSAIVYDIQTFKPEYKSHSKSSKTHKKRDSKSPKSSKSPKKSVKKHVKRILK